MLTHNILVWRTSSKRCNAGKHTSSHFVIRELRRQAKQQAAGNSGSDQQTQPAARNSKVNYQCITSHWKRSSKLWILLFFSAEASTPISSTHGATNSQERAKSIACATCLCHLYPYVYLLIQCVSCNRQSKRRCKKSMQTKTRKKGGCAWRFSLWVVLQYNYCVERIACSTIYAGQLLYT